MSSRALLVVLPPAAPLLVIAAPFSGSAPATTAASPTPNPIQAENALPGVPPADWLPPAYPVTLRAKRRVPAGIYRFAAVAEDKWASSYPTMSRKVVVRKPTR